MTKARKTQIVVVGGGAGGLELATRLGARFGRDAFDIILVEKNRTLNTCKTTPHSSFSLTPC